MPRVMIIRVRIHLDAAAHRLIAHLHPFLQGFAAIENRLVPCFRQPLDSFAVAQPANVREIGCDRISVPRRFGAHEGHLLCWVVNHDCRSYPYVVMRQK